jgi:tetratricopeptide (TPR) repeat protein
MSVLVLALLVQAAAPPVRVWEDTRTIPTYEQGPPDVNPPFDLFSSVRFNYPYTMRLALTDRRAPREWRTLNLENEYLRVEVVPDLGGHLLRAVDKATGADMFYANPSFKFAQVAYRGAWATFGIEFNFPISHSWVTVSPVDWASVRHPDGSASIVVGNVDLVYGMQWRVELTLRPGRAVLEQRTTLYNRSDVRHRFYWWTNAAVRVWDDSHLIYPMEFTATHGFTDVDTWPLTTKGVDLSRPGNHLEGPVSLFAHGSREPFMGVYHPRTDAGVAHYSSPADLPAKKVWSWGADADGLDWRRALSDDESAQAEIQAGLFRNQETYGFLEPQEEIRFEECWLPVRRIGGFTRVTPEAVLLVERSGKGLRVGLNVSAPVAHGRLRVSGDGRAVADEALSLDPTGALERTLSLPDPSARYTVEVQGDDGGVLVRHTEGVFDFQPRSEITVGPQPRHRMPPRAEWTDGDFLEQGDAEERLGQLLVAWDTYAEGRRRYPESFELLKAAGRLATGLKRFEDAEDLLAAAEARRSNDAEVLYARGLSLLALGDSGMARLRLEGAVHDRATRPAALLKLAGLAARAGRSDEALAHLGAALRDDPGAVRAGALQVVLLRRAGRPAEAKDRLDALRRQDPTSLTLRHEAVLLGAADADAPALWRHLAGDPQRVLQVALDLMEVGAWDDAVALLGRTYPTGEGVFAEPGTPAPQDHPEVAYYRGYCREKLGESGRPDFAAASAMSTRYVFPMRAHTLPVLRAALAANPDDATAHFLLGSLYLSGGMAENALEEWEDARRLDPTIPVLHRNLGLTWLHARHDPEKAREVLAEGTGADPTNVEVYDALDQALSLLGRPAEERVAALERFPDPAALPSDLVLKLALALVEAGRFDEAEALFPGRFFPRAEFGTNVRQVYLEVKLQRALHLARAGEARAALDAVASLGAPVDGLDFTRDGLDPFLEGARVQYVLGEVHALCGDAAGARRCREAAAAAPDRYPYPDTAFAVLAAGRLGRPTEEGRARLEAALAAWENRLVVGTSFPGPNALGRGLFLRGLGREDEARARFTEALYLPDKMMSHHLGRTALRPEGEEK